MTTEQINVFEELLADPTFKGKKQLKHILWHNTTSPKYKLDECFKVTDRSHRIYGNPVINFKAKITRIYTWKDVEEYQYELQMECECNGNHISANVYKSESELNKSERCDDNVNTLGEMISKHAESLDI